MSNGMCDYLALKLQDHVTGVASFTAPTQIRVSLWTARGTVAQSNAGTDFSEVSAVGTAYARVNIGVGTANWDAAALLTNLRAVANKLLVAMGTPTGSGWGTVAGFTLYDQGTNPLWWGDITPGKACPAGVPVTIPIGDIDLAMPHGS